MFDDLDYWLTQARLWAGGCDVGRFLTGSPSMVSVWVGLHASYELVHIISGQIVLYRAPNYVLFVPMIRSEGRVFARGSTGGRKNLAGYRWFESISLQESPLKPRLRRGV